jgi:hypothetical protein
MLNKPRWTTAIVVLCLAAALSASATQTRIALSSAQTLWDGFPAGVTVSENGVLQPGPAFLKSADLPGVPLCAIRSGKTWWVGTGPSGDLLKVEGNRMAVAHHFEEPLVTALAADESGVLWVGTSTPGRVYRLTADGKVTLVAEVKADYVWALIPDGSGALAATGEPGKVLRIVAGKAPEVVLDTPSDHVRCLVRAHGDLWAGTASPAALYRIDGGGSFLAATFDQEEVAALAPAKDGVWIGANEKAGQPPSSTPSPKKNGGAKGSSSLLFMPFGDAVRTIETFSAQILALTPSQGECLAGLSDGRLFLCDDAETELVARWEDSPVVAVESGSGNSVVITASPGALRTEGNLDASEYVSPPLDFSAPARIGRTEVAGTGAALLLRAGNSPRPDAFWSPWTPARSVGGLPPSQYAQWKVVLAPGAKVLLVSLAYRTANRPPEFASAQVHPPGEIFVRMPSQLGDHLVREVNQTDSIFPGLAVGPSSESSPQTYYLQGFRMVSWKAKDPDGDDLAVRVQVQPEGTATWLTLAERVSDPYFVFDSRSLPDGRYRLRLTAIDNPSNPEGGALESVLELPVFLIDNTAPLIQLSPLAPGQLTASVSDNVSVQAVRVSVDGKPWQPIGAAKGAPGASSAEFLVNFPARGDHWIAIQAVDPSHNETTAAWIARAK